MIFDKIQYWKTYFKHNVFNTIFDDLAKISQDTPNGVHFKNKDYYFKVMSYKTLDKPKVIENHRKEVDIQIVLSGSEKIKLYSKDNLEILRDYSVEDDSQFYTKKLKKNAEIILKPEYMAVFFNQDIHRPQYIANNKTEKIKKIVIKVNEEFFTQ
jgi:YhcH/YjgK/YiaL family protein